MPFSLDHACYRGHVLVCRLCRYHDEVSSRTYETLVREVLRDGTIDDEGRATLRAHRIANDIDSLHHMRVLRKLGWDLDDLEAGKRRDHQLSASPASPAVDALSSSKLRRAFEPPRHVTGSDKKGDDTPPVQ